MFATAINCMDGRTQQPVSQYIKNTYGVKYVDTITEPGADKLVAETDENDAVMVALKAKLEISVGKHHSKVIAIVGHAECAGNPVDDDTHKAHIRTAVGRVKQWYPDLEVFGVWVGSDWKAVRVD